MVYKLKNDPNITMKISFPVISLFLLLILIHGNLIPDQTALGVSITSGDDKSASCTYLVRLCVQCIHIEYCNMLTIYE